MSGMSKCFSCGHYERRTEGPPCSDCVENDKWLPVGVVAPLVQHKAANYLPLREILNRAYDHAAAGKGAERHATGQDFAHQPMQTISDLVGDNHGCLFQAIKKCQESTRLPKERAVHELLGAINYLAGAIIFLEKGE